MEAETIDPKVMSAMEARAEEEERAQRTLDNALIASVNVRQWAKHIRARACTDYELEELKALADRLHGAACEELARRSQAGESVE